MQFKLFKKGSVSTTAVLITAVGTILASALGGWFTSDRRVSEIDTKIEVVQERENNHYNEVQKSLTRIESKIDAFVQTANSSKALENKK